MEATLILPIVIVGVLTLSFIIKSMGITENATYSCVDENKKIAIESYERKVLIGFKGRLEDRLKKENRYILEPKVDNMGYLYWRNGQEGMISFDLKYGTDIKTPIRIYPNVKNTEKFLFRGFVGEKSKWPPFDFENMEKDGTGGAVWIFPDKGKKFHKDDCTYVKVSTRQVILTEKIKRKYDQCKKCDIRNLPNGMNVYLFPSYGESYHRIGCKTINRYVMAISELQAQDRGYTSCLKCGGI